MIVQFGGQTPLKLARTLEEAGVPLLGTPVDAIDLAEDRGRFGALLRRLDIDHPPYGTALSAEEARGDRRRGRLPAAGAAELRARRPGDGDLLLDRGPARPTSTSHVKADQEHPLLLDRFLENAIEVDVDALGDGESVHVAGIMQHVEEAGVHSGDSACVIPPLSLGEEMLEEIRATTERIALALGVIGLINIQYAIAEGELYVIEANPRASRTVPFVSKAIGVPLAKVAARLMLGEKLADQDLPDGLPRARQRQGGGAAVRPLRRRRLGARPGDEVDRRGDGHRRRLPDRLRQGPGRRRGDPAARGLGLHHRHRHRQGGGDAAGGAPPRRRLRGDRDRRHGDGDRADGGAGAPDQQAARGLPARRST